ncbi:MAG TPA: GvpL/GvpF family gas vesicle protein [Bacteroidota bacterium]|nr:GvpL/GvpF family gas vesicle protein [Bacteroidota bacterium]
MVMKQATRKRLSELILEELSEKIRKHENIRLKLEAFADLPVSKVADAILQQFDYLLSGDLRELIANLIEEEGPPPASPGVEEMRPAPAAKPEPEPEEKKEPSIEFSDLARAMIKGKLHEESSSIMQHFSSKEAFPSEKIDIELRPDDWFYLYGFSYAPDSTGKGVPSKMLSIKGVDNANNLFLLDLGDVRMYVNKLTMGNYASDKGGKPTITSHQVSRYKYEHERILNILRSEEVIVSLPFWTIVQGHQYLIKLIEDRYVELLRSLIEVHDAIDWDVDVLAFDHHILRLPSISDGSKARTVQRDTRHAPVTKRDDKMLDKVIFREKSIAHEIHNQLLLVALKSKVDYMIRLDTAFMDDWKSILSARYTINKDKRKMFCQSVQSLQEEYKEYELMFRVTTPSNHFILDR